MDALAVDLASAHARAAGGTGPDFVGVAPCGTALTAAQVDLLDHASGGLADRGIVVAFDGDAAGRQASVRAYALLREVQAWPHAVDLPAGQDPAGLLQQHGPARLHAALLSAADRPLADLVVDERIDRYTDQMRWPEGRVAAGRSAAAVLVTLPPDQVGRQVIRLIDRLDLSASVISGMVSDAVTDPNRTPPGETYQTSCVPHPRVTEPTGTGNAPLVSSTQTGGGVLSAVKRARAGFPSPLKVTAAAPELPAGQPTTAPARPPLRRHV